MTHYEDNGPNIIYNYDIDLPIEDAVKVKHGDFVRMMSLPNTNVTWKFMPYILFT